MNLPPQAQRRVEEDHVVWLTTVADSGAPAPNPVWFVADGDDLVVFTDPHTRKVHNIEQRSTVSVHFNSDFSGGDVVVITADVDMDHGQAPSANPAYLDKYREGIKALGLTVEELDRTFNTRLRLRPKRVRLTAGEP
ncbi:MAG: TIGR03667 family PPOX class F420-dependent oxidoreductase [Nocardioidaceae bacterium]